MDLITPSPGSPEAVELGCICPQIDNSYGRGRDATIYGEPLFWVTVGCPLHDKKGQDDEPH